MARRLFGESEEEFNRRAVTGEPSNIRFENAYTEETGILGRLRRMESDFISQHPERLGFLDTYRPGFSNASRDRIYNDPNFIRLNRSTQSLILLERELRDINFDNIQNFRPTFNPLRREPGESEREYGLRLANQIEIGRENSTNRARRMLVRDYLLFASPEHRNVDPNFLYPQNIQAFIQDATSHYNSQSVQRRNRILNAARVGSMYRETSPERRNRELSRHTPYMYPQHSDYSRQHARYRHPTPPRTPER
jgi:hypothetical protein